MESPSSIRRITRSQSKISINSSPKWKCDDSEKVVSAQKNMKLDRSALVDITNDSPIVGLAAGSVETPSSYAQKLGEQLKQIPGKGESLLRYQVKNLLQKIEEEADLSRIPLEHRRFLQLQGVVNSPSSLLAPTQANIPQVLYLSGDIGNKFDASTSEIQQSKNQQVMIIDESLEETLESQKDVITRSLLLDFSEKSEITDSSSSPCSSVLTYQGGIISQETSTDDDDASVWSMQVNASTQDEDEESEIENVEEEYKDDEEEAYEDCEEGGLLDELCDGLCKISVQEKTIPEFEGKHTRFVYNSDDEIEGQEDDGAAASPSVLCLKGMPVPEGKHLRFSDEEEE